MKITDARYIMVTKSDGNSRPVNLRSIDVISDGVIHLHGGESLDVMDDGRLKYLMSVMAAA